MAQSPDGCSWSRQTWLDAWRETIWAMRSASLDLRLGESRLRTLRIQPPGEGTGGASGEAAPFGEAGVSAGGSGLAGE